MADTLTYLKAYAVNGVRVNVYQQVNLVDTNANILAQKANIISNGRLLDNTVVDYAAHYDATLALQWERYPANSVEDITKVIAAAQERGYPFDQLVIGNSPSAVTYVLPPAPGERKTTIVNYGAGALTILAASGDVIGNGAVVLRQNESVEVSYIAPANTWLITSTMFQGWSIVSQASDSTVINSAVLAADSQLSFPLLANTKYRIRGKIFFDTTAAGDFKYTFTGPASPTGIRTKTISAVPGAAPTLSAIGTVYPSAAGVAITSTSGTTGGYIEIDYIVWNGVNAGNFTFQFAQNTATNDTGAIVRAGSYLEFSIA